MGEGFLNWRLSFVLIKSMGVDMNISYFKEHIHEELTGAKDYIEKAIESKITNYSWVPLFVRMADMEISHATTLMKMMEECIKKNPEMQNQNAMTTGSVVTVSSASPETVYKEMMKEYGETMTYITNMKRGL